MFNYWLKSRSIKNIAKTQQSDQCVWGESERGERGVGSEGEGVFCSYSNCHILFLNGRFMRLVCNYSVFKFNKDSHYRKAGEGEIMECREGRRRREQSGQPRWNRVVPSPPQLHFV